MSANLLIQPLSVNFVHTGALWNTAPTNPHPLVRIIGKVYYCALAAIMAVLETMRAVLYSAINLGIWVINRLDAYLDPKPEPQPAPPAPAAIPNPPPPPQQAPPAAAAPARAAQEERPPLAAPPPDAADPVVAPPIAPQQGAPVDAPPPPPPPPPAADPRSFIDLWTRTGQLIDDYGWQFVKQGTRYLAYGGKTYLWHPLTNSCKRPDQPVGDAPQYPAPLTNQSVEDLKTRVKALAYDYPGRTLQPTYEKCRATCQAVKEWAQPRLAQQAEKARQEISNVTVGQIAERAVSLATYILMLKGASQVKHEWWG